MFKAPLLVLATAFVVGYASAQEGCYPAYKPSVGLYHEGDWVSSTKETDEPCVYGEDGPGCGQNNIRVVVKTFNFVCYSYYFCGNVGYAPSGIYGSLAWTQQDEPCSGTANLPTKPAPAVWSGGGGKCPAEFSSTTTYGGGDVVSVCSPYTDWCTVYKCKNDLPAPGKFCDMHGYEPGSSLYWSVAWDEEGSCSGAIEPTSSPTFDPVDDLGKCPEEYVAGRSYVGGDQVSKDNFVFVCKEWPFDGWCGRPGYEPLVDFSVPDAWTYAWTVVGHCSGTIQTTEDAGFLDRNSLGVCPPEYSLGTQYGPGERVSVCGHEHWCLVYRCASDMPIPSRWCGLDGYQPGSGQAWIMAWTEEGYCTITAAPTAKPSASPSISPEPSSRPSEAPSSQPSPQPSAQPSEKPSSTPSEAPSVSTKPSSMPSESPSISSSPSSQPSEAPSESAQPSSMPSESPSVSTSPSSQPSMNPSVSNWPTSQPSSSPSSHPSEEPSLSTSPSAQPSMNPSVSNWPTSQPSQLPSTSTVPSSQPSSQPSNQPSEAPSDSTQPSSMPSESPSSSASPSSQPSMNPSVSDWPTSQPSSSPSSQPSCGLEIRDLAGEFTIMNTYLYSITFDPNNPAASTITQQTTLSLGSFTGFVNGEAKFEEGAYCGPIEAPRTSTVKFEYAEDCASAEPSLISVSEPDTCVYEFVISGVCCPCCTVSPSKSPTTSPTTRPTSSPTPEVTPLFTTPNPADLPMNLALASQGATASQSSNCGGEASRGNDGNTDQNYFTGSSVFHTCNEQNAWWMVYLGSQDYVVGEVVLYNRQDCCSPRIINTLVEVLDADQNVVASRIIDTDFSITTFDFGNVAGKYVRVIKLNQDVLHLAEVEVYGWLTSTRGL